MSERTKGGSRRKTQRVDLDAAKGLYQKFIVTRADGSSRKGGKHEHCEYYVLDLNHDKFAVPALQAYARACRKEYPQLSSDLLDRVDALLVRVASKGGA